MGTPDRIRTRGRWSLVVGTVLAALMLGVVMASGAELVTAEVDGSANDVTVTQGSSANFAIKVSATGNVSCAQTSGSPSTAKVDTSFAISNAGALSSSNPSGALAFWATPCSGTNGAVTWTGAPTPYSVAASVTAGASTPIGTYTIALSSAAGTTAETNPNATGAKLEDLTATAITVHVVAPADTTPPVISPSVSGTLGSNGWYTSDVSVTWTVTDPESPGSLVKSGCVDQSITADQAETTYSCSATSTGGSAGPVSVTIKRDATAPSATTTLDTAPNGSNDWYTSAPAWKTSGTDGLSGLVNSPCETGTYSGPEGPGLTVSGTCTDKAGNSSSDDSPAFKLDSTGPSASLAVTAGTLGANGWYTSDVTVDTDGTDSISGPVSCTDHQFQTTETAGQVFNGSCTNDAGLTTHAAPLTVKLDKTGPSASLAVTAGTSGANGWYTSNVTVDTSGSDSISEPTTCTDHQFQTTETAGEVFTGSCTNGAGLTTDAAPLTVKLDKTGPSAALSVTAGTVGANGWYTSDVTVDTDGTDSISGPVTCTDHQFQTTETAGHVFNGSCTDDAGLTTNAVPLTAKVDYTGPSAALAVSAGTLGGGGWYRSDVTVSTSGTDSISNPTACTGNQQQTASTNGEVFNGDCTNDAGLTTNAAPLTVKLDKVAPTLSWTGGPANGGSFYFGSVPAEPTCTAVDPLYSGPAGCSVVGYSSAIGPHTLTATAHDVAGNSHSESRTYTVLAWTLTGFFQPVDMGGTYNVVKNGSTVPLKFRIFAGSTELTDVANVKSLNYGLIACNATAPSDDVETTATGGTVLRYDTTGGQFVYNWKTPSMAGKCYSVTMTTQDGSTLSAFFKLK